MNSSRLLNIFIIFITLRLVTAASAETSQNAKPVETKGFVTIQINRINLQNTASLPGVTSHDLSFDSNGIRLKGTLYTPTGAAGPFPGVVVAGAWTTVKEQMAGTYARELAARGFAALAFDFTGWSPSGGDIRYKEDPATKRQTSCCRSIHERFGRSGCKSDLRYRYMRLFGIYGSCCCRPTHSLSGRLSMPTRKRST